MSIREAGLMMLLDGGSGGEYDTLNVTKNGTYRASELGVCAWDVVNVGVITGIKTNKVISSDGTEKDVPEPDIPEDETRKIYRQHVIFGTDSSYWGTYLTWKIYHGDSTGIREKNNSMMWPLSTSYANNVTVETGAVNYEKLENGEVMAFCEVRYTGHNSSGDERVWVGTASWKYISYSSSYNSVVWR